jgi:hypothetical protein
MGSECHLRSAPNRSDRYTLIVTPRIHTESVTERIVQPGKVDAKAG